MVWKDEKEGKMQEKTSEKEVPKDLRTMLNKLALAFKNPDTLYVFVFKIHTKFQFCDQ